MTIQQLNDEYELDDTIWNTDLPIVRRLKQIIFNDLSETDKRIILLYAELSSQRKVGKQLGVSTATINKQITNIRKKIYDILQSDTNSNSMRADN